MSNLSKAFEGSKVLITGHTGFKGSWLTIWLESMNAKVYGISNGFVSEPSHYKITKIEKKIKSYDLNIKDNTNLSKIITEIKPDYLFHLAAQPIVNQSYIDPINTWETNTIGTINVLNAIKKLDKKCVSIFITSDKCYENLEWVYGYRETDRLGGKDPYSASKAGAEIAIKSYFESFFKENSKVRIGIARAGNVIGGGDWANNRIVPDCIKAWAADSTVELRNPNATRPWQHVLEPLSGYLTLAMSLNESSNLNGEAFNFGPPSQQNHKVEELVEKMSEYWSKVNWKTSNDVEGYSESELLKLNCDKAMKYLKWEAVWDFQTTIDKTINWYKNFYESSNVTEILNFSQMQIQNYLDDAKKRNLIWAK